MSVPSHATSRRRLVLLALLSIVLALPILWVGFVVDDYPQLMTVRGFPTGGSTRFDLYRFTPSDPAIIKQVIERGPWPWWTDPELKAALFRPYASLLLNIDHALFGLASLGYAIHTLVYNTLLVVVVALFYRRVLPQRAVWLAALLFAVDDIHLQAAAWLAARYSVIAPMFGVLALWAYIRHREDDWRPGLPLAVLGFVLSLSCGELGLSVLAFFGMYEIVMRRDPWKRRIAALTPLGVTTALYLIVYQALGYGAAHSTLYVHPFTDPLRFMKIGVQRMTWLLGDLFGGLPADFSLAMPAAQPALTLFGLVATALFALAIRATYRTLEQDDRRRVLWLLSASVIATIPSLGAPSGGRVLVLPSIGALAVTGLILNRAWEILRPPAEAGSSETGDAPRKPQSVRPSPLRAGLWLSLLWLGWINLVSAPVFGFMRVKGLGDIGRMSSQGLLRVETNIRNADSVVIIQCTNPLISVFGAAEIAIRHPERDLARSSWHALSLADRSHRITRSGPQSFIIEVIDGDLLDNPFAKVFRSEKHPMHVGDEVQTRAFTVRVEAERRGIPFRFHVQFKSRFDDPSLFLARCTAEGLEPAALPALGQSVTWKPSPLPMP